MNRQNRRRLKAEQRHDIRLPAGKTVRATGEIDRVCAADHAFFETHPDRQYRIRRLGWREMAIIRKDEYVPPLRPGDAWFLALWAVGPGKIACMQFAAPATTREDELGEAHCRSVFDGIAFGPAGTVH